MSSEATPLIAIIAGAFSEALAPLAGGLCVSLLALSCNRYLRERQEIFELEMRAATLEMTNYLSLRQRH